VFTITCHCSIYWAKCIHFTRSCPISLCSLILYSTYAWSSEWFHAFSFSHQSCTHFSSLQCMLHATTITISLIWSRYFHEIHSNTAFPCSKCLFLSGEVKAKVKWSCPCD
jgi:hypothetical protein